MKGDDVADAVDIARRAGARLLEIRSRGGDPTTLRAAGDAASQAVIAAELRRRFPADAILSEEADDDSDRATNPRVWIIDPLDGTREFSEPPRDDWAVHVALVADDELVVGAVALPALDLVLSSAGPFPPQGPLRNSPRVLVSRTRPTPHAVAIADALGGELIAMGSAGAKAMAVVRGLADVYAHSGGQFEWDSAAPVAVAAAAGLHVSRLDGTPLLYNQADPALPDLLVCRPELAESVLETCAEVAR